MSKERIVDAPKESDIKAEDTADKGTAEVVAEIPAKFRGKSVQDILDSYSNLEKEYGRQSGELGELRKVSDQLIQRSLKQAEDSAERRPEPVTDDTFLEKPLESVRRLVEEAVKPLKAQAEEMKQANTLERLEKKHPGFRDLVADTNFQEWVMASPVREGLWAKAANGDYEYADEVFTLYKGVTAQPKQGTEVVTSKAEQQRNQDLDVATTISPGTSRDAATGKNKTVYRRSELIRLQIEDPLKYHSLQDEIMAAYADGRVK